MKVSLGQGDMANLSLPLCNSMNHSFQVIFEDNHILVVIKPVNILSQADSTGDLNMVDLVNDYLRTKYNKPGKAYVGLLHRLDRPVSGLMIFAKTSKSFERIQQQIKFRTMDKYYLAVTASRPPNEEDTLRHFILKDSKINKVLISDQDILGSKVCQLRYRVIGHKGFKYLIQVKLITGRSHQIRAQMAYIECPLLGDVKYGDADPRFTSDLALFSALIGIDHPTLKERMCWFAYPESKGYWEGLEEFFPKSAAEFL